MITIVEFKNMRLNKGSNWWVSVIQLDQTTYIMKCGNFLEIYALSRWPNLLTNLWGQSKVLDVLQESL